MLIKIFVLVISIFMFSCSLKQDSDFSKEDKSPVVAIKKIYNYKNELFDISINFNVPYNNFVFYKQQESFIASVNVAMQIFDTQNDSIILQNSWLEEIVVNSYGVSRSFEEYYSFYKLESLPAGDFQVLINIQDLDNKNVINFQKSISLSLDPGFGETIIYTKAQKEGPEAYQELNTNRNLVDSDIRLLFQYFSNVEVVDLLELELTNNKNSINKSFKDLEINNEGFYTIDFTIPEDFYGKINAEITTSSLSKNFTLFNYYGNDILWSDDIKEIVGMMRYILPGSELKVLNDMNDKQKIDYIIDFWKDKDPDETTEENELLTEFINRFNFVNQNLSDVGRGWRSDRGRIYVIYGAPDTVDRYSDPNEGAYEVWTYPNGLKFTFLDRNRFGNYILIRQSL